MSLSGLEAAVEKTGDVRLEGWTEDEKINRFRSVLLWIIAFIHVLVENIDSKLSIGELTSNHEIGIPPADVASGL